MGLQFRIFSASNSGQSGAGGSVTPTEVGSLVPGSIVSPHLGQGPKYIYRKYFLNITNFANQTGIPVISNVSVSNITDTSATVNWSTNEPTTTELEYGTTINYGNSINSGTTLTSGNRSAVLNGLTEHTPYYYKITATDTDELSVYSFGSFNTIDITPPSFSNTQVSFLTSTSATITWTTNEPATSQVFYGSGVVNTANTLDASLVTDHSMTLTGLGASGLYRYYVSSKDAYANSGRFPSAGSQSFVTLGAGGSPALTITNVNSGSITDTTASITWTTSNSANSIIRYSTILGALTGSTGISGGVLSYSDNNYVLSHTGSMTNMSSNKRYYYQINSTDVYNQIAYAPSSSGAYSLFTTDTTAPGITFLGFDLGSTTGVTHFTTDELATGYVKYDTSSFYVQSGTFRNTVTGTYATQFDLTVTGLQSNTAYNYQNYAIDHSGNIGYDIVRSFTTNDITPPVFSNLLSGTTSSTATFSWTTDELSDTVFQLGTGTIGSPAVFTGTTGNHGILVLNHTATIQSLTPSTNYIYVISSTDAASNRGSVTGLISTIAASTGGGGDTTPPVISNVAVTAGFNIATFNWDTDEYSSTRVDYSNNSSLSPSTGATGQSGTVGHNVAIGALSEGTTYYYRLTSADASGNSASTSINNFTTNTNTVASNFALGDNVAQIEIEWPDTSGMIGNYFPIKVCVPVRDAGDLVMDWITTNGFYVQREVIKRDGGGTPKIVECIFPVPTSLASAYGLNTGDLFKIYLLAAQASSNGTWSQYDLPSTSISITMPGGKRTIASLKTPTNGIVRQVRGDSSSIYCRTYKIYNRCTLQGVVDNHHPSIKSFGVHSYVTYYNTNFFPDFYPQVDVRVSNAWIDENISLGNVGDLAGIAGGGQNTRGAIYYRSISIAFPSISQDNIQYAITNDVVEHCMSETTASILLVKPMAQIQPNQFANGGQIMASEAVNYDCDHAFFAGSALSYRLAFYPQFDGTAKNRMQKLAGVEYVGFVIKDDGTVNPNNIALRNWGNCRSFGPANIYCPTVNTHFEYGGYTGRTAMDQAGKATWNGIKNSFAAGNYAVGGLAGSGPGNTNYPIEYGPYRPWNDLDGGAVGGFRIAPWDGFNHSKYSVLWMLQDHKMQMHRHFQRMYSDASQFSSDGEPASYDRWVQLHPGTNNTMRNGGENINGLLPFQQAMDWRTFWFERQWPTVGDGNYSAPWNTPTNPVTSNHLVNEGCSYHNDKVTYINGAYDGDTNGRLHLNDIYTPIDFAHQIRYAAAMIAVSEMLNDLMIKDDLMMQADFNMVCMCTHPSVATGFSLSYNLADIYYGFDRSANGGYLSPGIKGNPHNGWMMGRIFAWPLWTVNGAYQLGSDTFRARAIDFLVLSATIFAEGYMTGIGTINRSTDPVGILQHPGLLVNGLRVYLVPNTSDTTNSTVTLNKSSVPTNTLVTTISSANTDTLVAKFIADNSTAWDADSMFATSRLINGDTTFYVDTWIKADGSPTNSWQSWKMSLWAKHSGSGSYRLRARLYLYDPITGGLTRFSNNQTNGDEYSASAANTSGYQNLSWTIKQADPNNGFAYQTFTPYVNGNLAKVIVELYANCTNAGDTISITYDNNSFPIQLNTSVKNVNGCIFDFAQVFEHNLVNLAHYSNASQVIKPYATLNNDTTLASKATTIFTAIRKYYNEFYTLPQADYTTPGPQDRSSWLKIGSQNVIGAESWLIASAYSVNHPNGSTAPLSWGTTLTATQGYFAGGDIASYDPGQYSTYSSFIGILCMLELGDSWTNSPSDLDQPYTPGFLLNKWCKMNQPNADPIAHRDYIYANTDYSQLYAMNSAGCIGFIDYYQENPGFIANATTNTPSVPNVRLFISNEGRPSRVSLAATPNVNDVISGASTFNNNPGDITWTSNGTRSTTPSFVRPKGGDKAITLYNKDGVYGGDVPVTDTYTESVPFWVKYEFDENAPSNSSYVTLGVIAGAGDRGILIPGTGATVTEIPHFTYYNDPSGDYLTLLGSSAGGTNSVYQLGNKYYLDYDGDEHISYSIDYTSNSGNAVGLIRVFESTSSCFPVYNGGLFYRDVSGNTYAPTGLTGVCTLNSIGISNNRVIARYTDAIDSGRRKKYTFSIDGKILKVKMECTDGSKPYSGNYYQSYLGVASGCNSPKITELCGNSMNPIGIFNNSLLEYYWGSIPDLTQSNAQRWIVPNPATGVPGTNTFNHGYLMVYNPSTGNTIVSNINDTFLVGISSRVKDLFAKSSAPKSPFYDITYDKFHVLASPALSGSSSNNSWNHSAGSISNLISGMNNWGMDNIALYIYNTWSAYPHVQEYFPAVDPGNFSTTVKQATDLGYLMGVYTLYNSVQPSCSYYNTGYLSYTYTGTFKISAGARPTDPAEDINAAFLNTVADQDFTLIKDNYGINSAYWDVMTYEYPNPAQDTLDQGNLPGRAHTIRDGLIGHKLGFDSARQILNGPLWGEGCLASYDSDMQWLFHGYVDATLRCLPTNTGVDYTALPSGSIRSPSRWWNAVDYEWLVHQPNQPQQGMSLESRFFSASDYDVANTQTGGWQFSDMFPFTTGAMDRMRAYTISHARCGFLSTQGYFDGLPNNSITNEQFIVHYYMTNALQQRVFSSTVESIRYYNAGSWDTFDEIYKLSKDMNSFTGKAVNINLINGLKIYVNHNQVPGNTLSISFGGNSFTLPRDGFVAYSSDGNFLSFNAAATINIAPPDSPLLNSTTNGSVIQYTWDNGNYQFFHGKGTSCTGFGNITTSGSNQSMMKIYNYNRGTTIYSTTGSSTYPNITVTNGFI